jgi:hypothetical protein
MGIILLWDVYSSEWSAQLNVYRADVSIQIHIKWKHPYLGRAGGEDNADKIRLIVLFITARDLTKNKALHPQLKLPR